MTEPDADAGRQEVAPDKTGETPADPGSAGGPVDPRGPAADAPPSATPRRRGSRGGRARPKPDASEGPSGDAGSSSDEGGEQPARARTRAAKAGARAAAGEPTADDTGATAAPRPRRPRKAAADDRNPDELPERHRENKPSAEAAERALVRKPRIGDTMPAPDTGRDADAGPRATRSATSEAKAVDANAGDASGGEGPRRKRRRGGRGRGSGGGSGGGQSPVAKPAGGRTAGAARGTKGRGRSPRPVEAITAGAPVDLDDETFELRRGRERNGRPVGRYLMAVHVGPAVDGGGRGVTQIAVLEGRALLEHYVSHPADDVSQIHGNIYQGKVQNVLPGMEAAFVDIGTPKNAVLYRGDTRYDAEDIEEKGANPRIEQILKARQSILTQVTKNPIAHKGARLTQEVSLPGRFVVLIPNSTTYGISKRLPDNERKRLRSILDKVKPKAHGLIVRTAAENVTAEEIERDVLRLAAQWDQIEALSRKAKAPSLLYREPDMAVRVIREEFNNDYRRVVIDDKALFEEVRDYVRSISPALEDRVELYDTDVEALPLLEKFHLHEQLHKALDRKVWLPSGGSIIIEGTEALTVIDVNTGKNVGTSSLEETVYRNNLEAATEIARQLRLRDIGGIIVIDFVDMEVRANRDDVIGTFRDALARDKTRTQVFDISELGLVEMTRKRIGEGLLESFSGRCPMCEGRGVVIDRELLGN